MAGCYSITFLVHCTACSDFESFVSPQVIAADGTCVVHIFQAINAQRNQEATTA